MSKIIELNKQTVKFLGRNYYDSHRRGYFMNYTCAGIEFITDSGKVEATLLSEEAPKDHEALVSVFVDDGYSPIKTFPITSKEGVYTLYEGEKGKKVKIRICKISEWLLPIFGIRDIIVDDDATVSAAPKKRMLIEFVGDSFTCAFGNKGKISDVEFDQRTTYVTDGSLGYAHLTSQSLDADMAAVCISGYGLLSGWTDNSDKIVSSDTMQIPYAMSSDKKQEIPWDFENGYKPDLICINLGINDSSYTNHDPEKEEAYCDKHYEFLKTVRKNNPDAYILAILGPCENYTLYPMVEKSIARLKADGDTKCDSHYMGNMSSYCITEDDVKYGVTWHPRVIMHRLFSANFVGYLKEKFKI